MSFNTYAKPGSKPGIPRLNVVLFLVTLGTTFGAGYLQSQSLVELGFLETPWVGAAAFSLGMMAIVGCHEMGHKLMAQRRGVDATFPFFIPAPTTIGTFGAVISMKTRPRDKNALLM
jgi:Zn-dependent protease